AFRRDRRERSAGALPAVAAKRVGLPLLTRRRHFRYLCRLPPIRRPADASRTTDEPPGKECRRCRPRSVLPRPPPPISPPPRPGASSAPRPLTSLASTSTSNSSTPSSLGSSTSCPRAL